MICLEADNKNKIEFNNKIVKLVMQLLVIAE